MDYNFGSHRPKGYERAIRFAPENNIVISRGDTESIASLGSSRPTNERKSEERV